MIIRHAEKHNGGRERGVNLEGIHTKHELTVRGWLRAGALVRFFAPIGGTPPGFPISTPRSIFAAAATPATTTSIRRASLVLEVNGIRHPLAEPGFTLGRGTDADVRINDPGISRLHARISVHGARDPQVTIEDMGSTNGIVVDGRRVQSASLREGSRIELGSTRMLVRSPVSDV